MSLLSSLAFLGLVGVNVGAWASCKHVSGGYWWVVDIYMALVAGVSGGIYTYAILVPWETKWFFALQTGLYWFIGFGALYWLVSGYIDKELGRG